MDTEEIKLTAKEKRAIEELKKLAKHWPKSLLIFCGGTNMSIRKIAPDGSYFAEREIDYITDIPNDGGCGGD